VDAAVGLGVALWGMGRRDEAVAQLEAAVALDPAGFAAARALADAYYASGHPMAALKYYLQAAAADESCAEVFSNLGAILRDNGHPREALRALNRALTLEPGNASALVNSGLAMHDLGDVASALACYELAIAADPGHDNAHWNRAVALLVTGDFERGWAAHEHRRAQLRLAGPERTFAEPAWRGEPLDGRRILLHAEQGLGDQLQFVRFLPAVKRMGGTVVLECHPSLARLFAGCAGVDELARTDAPLPPFDCYAPIMSLPHLLGTRGAVAAEATPYLAPPGARTSAARLVAAAPGLRVGLVWAGEPRHRNDRSRSVALPQLRPLLDVPGTCFFSLQKGSATAALAALAPRDRDRLPDLAASFEDFGDTAHAVAALDLVIAVDTSVAHLAGALGKPVWLLLPSTPDWRWQLHRADSPWYPSARLFRQPAPGDWGAVVAQVAAALAPLAAAAAPGAR
jgi:hypothetical protein